MALSTFAVRPTICIADATKYKPFFDFFAAPELARRPATAPYALSDIFGFRYVRQFTRLKL
jgi:hypothetical protein